MVNTGEQPSGSKSATLAFFILILFIHSTSGDAEQPVVMLEQTSKYRSAVIRNVSIT